LESIATKEIAIAAFGGSAAIASVLLVFMGFMIVKADSLPEETADRVLRRYTRLAKLGLIPLSAQTVVIACSYAWLFKPDNSVLFYGWSIGFPVALLLFIVYSVISTFML
jgi:hypothetical protein